MGRLKVILAFFLAMALLVFVAQNTRVVDVRFLAWSLEMSRAIMLLAVLGIGFVLGWLVSSLGRLKD